MKTEDISKIKLKISMIYLWDIQLILKKILKAFYLKQKNIMFLIRDERMDVFSNSVRRLGCILFFLFYSTQVIAEMPKQPCESVCLDKKNIPAGGHCILLGKKENLYYRSLGKGFPTMIFVSGTGFPADGWFDTQLATQMAKKIRVISFDRLYTNNSCPNVNMFMPVTAQDVVDNLRKLLKQENIKPPYILIGQSFGGLYMQLYAREYPDEVAGLLLMDSVTSDGPVVLTKEEEEFLRRHHLDHPQRPNPENPLCNEVIGQLPSYLQLQNAPPLNANIPLIVMYATKECLPKIEGDKQLCMDEKRMQNHFEQQKAVYNMSNIHRLVKVEGEHMSFFDPDKQSIVLHELNLILEMSFQRAVMLSHQNNK